MKRLQVSFFYDRRIRFLGTHEFESSMFDDLSICYVHFIIFFREHQISDCFSKKNFREISFFGET